MSTLLLCLVSFTAGALLIVLLLALSAEPPRQPKPPNPERRKFYSKLYRGNETER